MRIKLVLRGSILQYNMMRVWIRKKSEDLTHVPFSVAELLVVNSKASSLHRLSKVVNVASAWQIKPDSGLLFCPIGIKSHKPSLGCKFADGNQRLKHSAVLLPSWRHSNEPKRAIKKQKMNVRNKKLTLTKRRAKRENWRKVKIQIGFVTLTNYKCLSALMPY